jgi:hypothetical protein
MIPALLYVLSWEKSRLSNLFISADTWKNKSPVSVVEQNHNFDKGQQVDTAGLITFTQTNPL